MICRHCGMESPDEPDVHFCVNCGRPMEAPQPFTDIEWPREPEEPGAGTPMAPDTPEAEATALEEEGGENDKEDELPRYCPWEDASLNYFARWGKTLHQSLFEPGKFFRRVPPDGPLTFPVVYLLLSVLVFSLVSSGYLRLAGRALHGGVLFPPLHFDWRTVSSFLKAAGCTPLAVLFWILLVTMVVHSVLYLLDGTRESIGATLRAFCYSSSVLYLALIPFCGGLIGFFVWPVLSMVGVKHAHRTTGGKVVASYLIPLFFSGGCLILLNLTILGAMTIPD